MAKKTWKIGEYARGGIIQAEVSDNSDKVHLRCKDYFTKELIFEFTSNDSCDLIEELLDWTSHYYMCEIMDWVTDHQVDTARIL